MNMDNIKRARTYAQSTAKDFGERVKRATAALPADGGPAVMVGRGADTSDTCAQPVGVSAVAAPRLGCTPDTSDTSGIP